jgi:hypothetical protein
MFTIFLFGTFWFWTLLAVAFLAITTLSEMAEPGKATTIVVIVALLLQFFGKINVFGWLFHHPKEFLLFLFAYLLIGVVYSILKWISFIRQKVKTDFEGRLRIQGVPESPKVDVHSTRIIGWMSFWPCNLVWTLLNDPVRRLFELTFEYTKSIFQRIADRAYEKAAQK